MAGLLLTVAGEGEHGEALVAELVLQVLQVLVLGREAALGRLQASTEPNEGGP